MKFEPKDYQLQADLELRRSISRGNKRIILKAPTGVGKTFIAARITESALKKGSRVTFVAPYTTLINQTVSKFMEQGLPLPGVMQGNHELTDVNNPVQIATAQTLGNRDRPICDIVIVDEAHLQFKSVQEWMRAEPNKIFIGLTATPFAAGMGKDWQDLINIKTLRICIEDGTLSKYEVWGVESPDLSKIGMSQGDYKQKELGDFMKDPILTGNIVSTWLERANNGQTIVFAVNVLHANQIANDFSSVGVSNEVIIAKTTERDEIFARFDNKETRILISVGCLIAGFDSYVDVITWACPSKSPIKFIQGIGRGLRVSEGKEMCTIFDHSGTFTDMGFIEDVDEGFYELCNGDKKESQIKKKERELKKKVPKECGSPECDYIKPAGEYECSMCGFKPRYGEDADVDENGVLVKLKGKEKKATMEEKETFYRELKGWQKESFRGGKVIMNDELGNIYRNKFGVWPRVRNETPIDVTRETLNYITSRRIAYFKSEEYANKRLCKG